MLRLGIVACLALGALAARADDYPQGLIREQLEQATASVQVDLSSLQPGELRSVEYVGRPVYVYRRTKADRTSLAKPTKAGLVDPSSARLQESVRAAYASSASLVWARLLLVDQPALEKRRSRSYRDAYLVVAGWSPRSGCRLDLRAPEQRSGKQGVFTDSCLGTGFDAAGRALQDGEKAAAEYNLYVPPHRFDSAQKLIIGLAPGARLPELEFSHATLYREADPTHNLIIAARYGDGAMLESALAKGADVNAFRADEGSPLDAAIIGSPIGAVKLLIERGARPTGRSLRAAEHIGRREVWELLENMPPPQGTR